MIPNITTFYCGPSPLEILRITKEGIWANPDVPVDEAAKKVLDAVDHNIKVLVQKAVEDEREACAKVAENGLIGHTIAKAIRARGKE